MQSLYSSGLTSPEDVLQHCLTLFRKVDCESLAEYLSREAPERSTRASAVGGTTVIEDGALAQFAHVLDVGARRVLPKHILRRSNVLGSLRLGPDVFQQRIALAACTGEEAVFEWRLRRARNANSSTIACGVDDEDGSHWVIESVRRESISSTLPLPTTPHPKYGPEQVVLAQLKALQHSDLFETACFSALKASQGENIPNPNETMFSLGVQVEAIRNLVGSFPYSDLLHHAEAVLGNAALPNEQTMLHEVFIRRQGAPRGEWNRFVWELSLQSNSCWMTSDIRAVVDE